MSEFLLELGSTGTRRSSLAGAELADSWLAANEFANRLGEFYSRMRGPHARLSGAFPDVNSLAEGWADINRISIGDAYDKITRMAAAYDVITSPSVLNDIYRTLGARIKSGHYDDRDWEGYLDLADARLDMKFDLVSRPGGDDRIRMGERPDLKFELVSRPGGDDRIRLSGGFLKKLTKKGGIIRKIGAVAKKVVPVAAAAVATYFTGGATAPLLGAALSHAITGKKPWDKPESPEEIPPPTTEQQQLTMQYAADMAANVQTLNEAGVAVPQDVQTFANVAGQVVSQVPGGQQALSDSFNVIRSGVENAGGDPGLLEAVDKAEEKAKGMPTWMYFAIGGGGILGLGMIALIVSSLMRPRK